VEQRVCECVKTLAGGHMLCTQKRPGDLVAEVARRLDISDVWARKLLKSRKRPNVPLLHGLVDCFEVEGGEAFFAVPPADGLNRVVLSTLAMYGDPASDSITALVEKRSVVATELCMRGAHMTTQHMEHLVAGALRSAVRPAQGDTEQ
jgi:hypothetical protein